MRSGAYAAEVLRCLDAFEPLTRRFPSRIVAGDFNVSGHGRGPRSLVDPLQGSGLVSAYHHHSGANFGEEQDLTIH